MRPILVVACLLFVVACGRSNSTSQDDGDDVLDDILNLHLDGYIVPESALRSRLALSMISVNDPAISCGNLWGTPPVTSAMTRAIADVGVVSPGQDLNPLDGERIRRIFVEECEAFRRR